MQTEPDGDQEKVEAGQISENSLELLWVQRRKRMVGREEPGSSVGVGGEKRLWGSGDGFN